MSECVCVCVYVCDEASTWHSLLIHIHVYMTGLLKSNNQLICLTLAPHGEQITDN